MGAPVADVAHEDDMIRLNQRAQSVLTHQAVDPLLLGRQIKIKLRRLLIDARHVDHARHAALQDDIGRQRIATRRGCVEGRRCCLPPGLSGYD